MISHEVRSGEVECTQNLPLPSGSREVISKRPSDQVKQIIVVMKRKRDNEENMSTNSLFPKDPRIMS